MKEKKGSDVLRCSFCNKSQRDVKKLIAGPTVYICNECVGVCLEIIKEDLVAEDIKAGLQAGLIPGDLLDVADKTAPGQTEAKRLLAAVMVDHARRDPKDASPAGAALLLGGPTGCGQLELVKSMAAAVGLPVAVIDVPLLFPDAPFKAKHDFPGFDQAAGVILLNHVDAAAMRGGQKDETRRVQQSLMSILDGAVVRLAGENNSTVVDTSRVLFIAVGTFADLVLQPNEGFGREALIRYGFLPELTARFGTFLMLKPLEDQNLREFLTRDGGLIGRYKERFEKHGMNVTFAPSAIETIVRLGDRRKGGIRGLNAIMNTLALALACETLPGAPRDIIVDDAFVVRNVQ
jgi:ATP-dependent Clp protease ATP-binding subunit ClpX